MIGKIEAIFKSKAQWADCLLTESFGLRVFLLYGQLLHPVRVNFNSLLLSLHQELGRALATALPQSVHHICQVGNDVAGTLPACWHAANKSVSLMVWHKCVQMDTIKMDLTPTLPCDTLAVTFSTTFFWYKYFLLKEKYEKVRFRLNWR